MQLAQQRFTGAHPVLAVDATSLRFEAGTYSHSFHVSSHSPPTPWAPATVTELQDEHLHELLALQPGLILLGTGNRLVFPSQSLLSLVRSRGIGLEVMDTRAAARTYNVLLAEEREVLLACLLPG